MLGAEDAPFGLPQVGTPLEIGETINGGQDFNIDRFTGTSWKNCWAQRQKSLPVSTSHQRRQLSLSQLSKAPWPPHEDFDSV